MPNHVTNKFIYVSNEELYSLLVLNEKEEVDFNKLIPIPNTMHINCYTSNVNTYGNSTLTQLYEEVKSKKGELYEVLKEGVLDTYLVKGMELTNNACIKKEGIINFLLSVYNETLYGYANWKDWSRYNWGTKWNSYDRCGSYEFSTAWSTPHKWLEELGKHINFILYFADEDIGHNFGCVVAREGKVTSHYYTDYSNDKMKNMIIALWIRDSLDDSEELKEQLIEYYEVNEKVAEEYCSKVAEFIMEFKTFANQQYSISVLPKKAEV